MKKPGQINGGEKIFVINREESIFSISKRLEKEGLIKNRWLFLAYLKITGREKRIQAGSFRFSGKEDLAELVSKLEKGRIDQWVTILEGWRREEIAEKLFQELSLKKEDFLKATVAKEGTLFPDSYLFPMKVGVSEVVKIMEENFEKKWSKIADAAKSLPLSKEQIVVLASLVEREAKFSKDRKLVAGILIKRMKADWPLQVDASIQYFKGGRICSDSNQDGCDWWPIVEKEDLSIKSLYNTYLNKGLPPTPICNPSFDSLESVVNYESSEYWFYLSDKEGRMHFAKTLEEHQENIKNYL